MSFGIIRDEFPPEKVGVGIGTVSSVFGAGGGIGLVLSGVILEHLDWHWLFLIGGIPVLISAALIARFVPESPIKSPTRPDYRGAATLSVGLVALLLAFSRGNAWGWASPRVVGLFVVAFVVLVLWVRLERRTPEPLIDIATLRRRGMALTNLTTFLIAFGMFAAFILLPNFVQIPRGLPGEIAAALNFGFGASPVEVGLFFVPSSLAMIVTGPAAGALGARFGPEFAAGRRRRPRRHRPRAVRAAARAALDVLHLDDLAGHRHRELVRGARRPGHRQLRAGGRPAWPPG